MGIKEMITNQKSSGFMYEFSCQYHGKCSDNSIENEHNDAGLLRVKQKINIYS